MPKLDKWSVVMTADDPFKAPEQCKIRLSGNVYGHPSFKDGEWVVTSSIVRLSEDGLKVITKSGSEYELGDVEPEYEKLYPGARQRVFESLKAKEVLK